ncbi:MAG TPA: DUF4258 domain-containing protein [Alphaproteobacteria bacterium]|jgi:hypothetical protein|nr:DUF4258 domain-containing protein [Alphaproteobacteria bacterium]
MENNYGGIIWTNHALQRLRERNIKQGDAWATWSNPQESRKGASGNWVYYRTYPTSGKPGNERIEVVAKKNEKGEWLILSVWSKPVFQSNKSNKTSFWGFIRSILGW